MWALTLSRSPTLDRPLTWTMLVSFPIPAPACCRPPGSASNPVRVRLLPSCPCLVLLVLQGAADWEPLSAFSLLAFQGLRPRERPWKLLPHRFDRPAWQSRLPRSLSLLVRS